MVTFDEFWRAYGLAYGERRDRLRAERAWRRLTKKDQQAAYEGINRYCEKCRQSGIAMQYGQGYLNGRRWEDEDVEPEVTPQQPPKQENVKAMELW